MVTDASSLDQYFMVLKREQLSGGITEIEKLYRQEKYIILNVYSLVHSLLQLGER